MDTNEAATETVSQEVLEQFAEQQAQSQRIMNKMGVLLEGEQVNTAFMATVSLADAFVHTIVTNPDAQKVFAKLFLSRAVTAALNVGLNDEELQQAIIAGDKDAKAAMQAGADFVQSIMDEAPAAADAGDGNA